MIPPPWDGARGSRRITDRLTLENRHDDPMSSSSSTLSKTAEVVLGVDTDDTAKKLRLERGEIELRQCRPCDCWYRSEFCVMRSGS
jgi:hypothetical protein